jgi:exonuclease III
MASLPLHKRRRLTLDRDISPPPLRRKGHNEKPHNTIASTASQTHTQGDTAQETVEILSVMSWNVNGISHLLPKNQKSIRGFLTRQSPYSEESDLDHDGCADVYDSPLKRFMKRHNWPQMICLQEVKIAQTDLATQAAVEKAANSPDGERPTYTAHFSLPRDNYNATGWRGKIYGVCTLIRNDLPSSNTKEVDWDLEGRVLVTMFEKWKLVIINGYWVNGTMNPYRDSSTGKVTGTRHDRKRVFHSLMLKEDKTLQGKGYEVLLIGDMNIARSALDGYPGIRLEKEHVMNRRDFNAKFFESSDGMCGIDTWRHIHGERRGYTYHGEHENKWGSSCDRVDLGIVSRTLAERGALIGADIWESIEERNGSDHVPLGVILDSGVLGKESGMG